MDHRERETPFREEIIDALRTGLATVREVNAVWLEGADALGTVDRLSDIDLVVDVADGSEESVLGKIRASLEELGEIDFCSLVTVPTVGLRHQVFHLSGTPPSLLIDAVVQSHSRRFALRTRLSSGAGSLRSQVSSLRHVGTRFR